MNGGCEHGIWHHFGQRCIISWTALWVKGGDRESINSGVIFLRRGLFNGVGDLFNVGLAVGDSG